MIFIEWRVLSFQIEGDRARAFKPAATLAGLAIVQVTGRGSGPPIGKD